jgi:hypothetical protein
MSIQKSSLEENSGINEEKRSNKLLLYKTRTTSDKNYNSELP